MAIGNVFKLVLNSKLGLKPFTNVFHYRQTFGVTGGEILAQEWINEVFPHIQSVVTVNTEFVSVEWLNYDNLADFGVDDSIAGQTGARAGESLPTFNTWGFQYNRETRATRNGSKRLGLISELDCAYGTATGAMLPVLQAAANGLAQFVNLGGTEIWQPVIARLSPDGATVLLTNDVVSVDYKRMTTQNSRKAF